MSAKNLLIILGATASGKTNLAVQVAHRLNGEIISADSRQVFRGMDIGTGKDLHEYTVEQSIIPHHLINMKDAGERYHVDSFKTDFYAAFESIIARGKLPVLCGGTGMYVHSVLQNHQFTSVPINQQLRETLQNLDNGALKDKLNTYAQELTAHADYSSRKRLIRAIEVAEFLEGNELEEVPRATLNPLVIGLYNERSVRRDKIIKRLNFRLRNGLIEEVQGLIAKGVSEEMLIFYGLEYKFVVAYLRNEIDFDLLKERLAISICQYAKRQMTFFRKMEKDGVNIKWIAATENKDLLNATVFDLVKSAFHLK